MELGLSEKLEFLKALILLQWKMSLPGKTCMLAWHGVVATTELLMAKCSHLSDKALTQWPRNVQVALKQDMVFFLISQMTARWMIMMSSSTVRLQQRLVASLKHINSLKKIWFIDLVIKISSSRNVVFICYSVSGYQGKLKIFWQNNLFYHADITEEFGGWSWFNRSISKWQATEATSSDRQTGHIKFGTILFYCWTWWWEYSTMRLN